MAKRKPSTQTADSWPKPFPIDNIPRDPESLAITAVGNRLYDIAMNLTAIHKLALVAVDDEDSESMLLLIGETARSSARAVDACLQRLGEGPPIGCFESELDRD